MAAASRDQGRARPSSGVVRQITEADDVPDLYADEFWLSSGPIASTLTLLTSIPPQPGVTSAPRARVVGRIRMSPQLAVELARLIDSQIRVNSTVISNEATEGPKH
jgi:hypothetical protein